jgi:hypothetical protein
MRWTFDPFRLLPISVAGWLVQQQRQAIDYLCEENRVLREQLGGKRLRFSDDQRRRLAAKAKVLGRRIWREVATLVTPETLLAWHRRLIADCRRLTAFSLTPDSFLQQFGGPRVLWHTEARDVI